MKQLTILAALLVATWALPSPQQLQIQWTSFKLAHKKIYKTELEELKRLAIFNSNLAKIEAHNELYAKNQVSYKLGINQFADWTHEEFLQYVTRHKTNNTRGANIAVFKATNAKIPDQIDWRDSGAVTYVKDQGQCGSCWSFSATGALEGQNFLTNGQLIPLSEQELVDCDTMENQGCDGGFMDSAFEYVIANGLSTEEEYPYEAQDGRCRRGSLRSAVAERSYSFVDQDEETLKEAVATVGPIAIAVDASNWQLYESGTFYDDACSSKYYDLNHGVLAVGYGVERGQEYWLVKNSWSEDWGERGYIKMARNANNNCGVATEASYPIL